MVMDSDEELVPTSQSQDLKLFFISPPRPGGSALLKDTTPVRATLPLTLLVS